jgi:site-specific recombinase XerD
MSNDRDLKKKEKELKSIVGVSITSRRGLLRVKLSAKVTGDKAEEKTYKHLKDALDYVTAYTNRNDKLVKELGNLSYAKSFDAVAAYDLLDDAGMKISLVEVVNNHISSEQEKQVGNLTLMSDALDTYMNIKSEKVSSGTYATYKAYEASLRLLYEENWVSDVGKEEIEEWLEKHLFGKSEATYNKYLSFARTFYKWCISKKYCVSNPCESIPMYDVELATPSVLSVSEVELILTCLRDHKMNELLLGFYIQLFSGLRRSEVMRLTWSCINDDYIKLEKRHTKTKKGRAIPLQACLKKHLEMYSQFLNPEYKDKSILSINHDKWDTMRDQLLRHLDWETIERNVLRHSYVSYRLGILGDVGKTSYECGHSADILLEHYNGLISKKEAEKYFKIVLI